MDLHACGFNGHGQLKDFVPDDRPPDDLNTFQKIHHASQITVVSALWSSTAIYADGSLLLRGSQCTTANKGCLQRSDVKYLFGDHTGVRGALDNDGSLYTLDGSHDSLHFVKSQFPSADGQRIDHLAIAGNGKVSICLRQQQSSSASLILVFHTLTNMLSAQAPEATYPIPCRFIQVTSLATAFVALTDDGEIYTWGASRYSHLGYLGRIPTAASPADRPCLVNSLGGIRIRKIASGGWITAALSHDRDLYVWGGRPGDESRISALPPLRSEIQGDAELEDVTLVDIDGGIDVLDIGVGEGHAIVLTADGRVFSAGRGEDGQLGTGQKGFAKDWVEVTGLEGQDVRGVECGYSTSFAVVSIDG